jgi:hypothetical protein
VSRLPPPARRRRRRTSSGAGAFRLDADPAPPPATAERRNLSFPKPLDRRTGSCPGTTGPIIRHGGAGGMGGQPAHAQPRTRPDYGQRLLLLPASCGDPNRTGHVPLFSRTIVQQEGSIAGMYRKNAPLPGAERPAARTHEKLHRRRLPEYRAGRAQPQAVTILNSKTSPPKATANSIVSLAQAINEEVVESSRILHGRGAYESLRAAQAYFR